LEPVEITPDAFAFLKSLPYPGNIRELKNLVDRTLLVSGKSILASADFEKQYEQNPGKISSMKMNSVLPLEEMEKTMILKALELYGSNYSKVAAALGLTRQALYRRLEKYRINL
jgi:two-component system NtrC family response regulator